MPDTTVDRSARIDPSTPLTAREAAALDEADEQRARAEAAEQESARLREELDRCNAERQRLAGELHDATTAAGRCGDILPAELDGTLPPIVCALPAGHAGWHRDERGAEWGPNENPQFGELGETRLTAEQEIRAEAIADATRCLQGALTRYGDVVAANIVGVAALALAARFEAYIRDGDGEPDPVYCVRCGHSCAHNPPHPLVDGSSGPVCQDEAWCEQERLRTGQICQPGQPYACGDYHHAGQCIRPTTPDTKPATRHFSPNCACGINDAGERVVDPICARLSTEAGDD